MLYNQDTLDRFERITGGDARQLLSDFLFFNDEQKQDIIDYYAGDIQEPNADSFSRLNELRFECDNIINLYMQNKRSFESNDNWALLMNLESIKTSLITLSNSSKFLRSAIGKDNFNPNPLVDITLRQGQTLESLAGELNSQDPQNEWVDIFLNNKLIQEDYTGEGGNLLQVTFQGGDSLFISSVVDTINSGEKTYGLDIEKRFSFENNDLKTLTYQETLIQSLEILSTLRKKDNPAYPNDGVKGNLAVGTTIGALAFPSLFRQLYNTFAKDDSLRSFAINDVRVEGDALLLEYQVVTRAKEVQTGTLSI